MVERGDGERPEESGRSSATEPVSVVIPAYDEEASVGRVARQVHDVAFVHAGFEGVVGHAGIAVETPARRPLVDELEGLRLVVVADDGDRVAAFELTLADALRPLGSSEDAIATASALLGRELGVERVMYGEVDVTVLDRHGLTRVHPDPYSQLDSRWPRVSR